MSMLFLKNLREISDASKHLRDEIEPIEEELNRLEEEAVKLEEDFFGKKVSGFLIWTKRFRTRASEMKEQICKVKKAQMRQDKKKAKIRDSVRKEVERILHEIENLVTSKALNQESSIAQHLINIVGGLRNKGTFHAQVHEQIKEDLQKFGFKKADAAIERFSRTYYIAVTLDWSNFETPGEARGNMIMECPVCRTERPMACLSPCGHLCCSGCHRGKCPYCRTTVAMSTAVFNVGS